MLHNCRILWNYLRFALALKFSLYFLSRNITASVGQTFMETDGEFSF